MTWGKDDLLLGIGNKRITILFLGDNILRYDYTKRESLAKTIAERLKNFNLDVEHRGKYIFGDNFFIKVLPKHLLSLIKNRRADIKVRDYDKKYYDLRSLLL